MRQTVTAAATCFVFVFLDVVPSLQAFGGISTPVTSSIVSERRHHTTTVALSSGGDNEVAPTTNSRRSFIAAATVGAFACFSPSVVVAAKDEPTKLQSSLYNILRVREAIAQETRLIKSGKFKDAQRANVKLAVTFILKNYDLNPNFIKASAYLEGEKRYQAADTGQRCVQSLMTILEYFDSSDVQNIKVSTSGLGDKEVIVLKGLDASKSTIDEFLAYFPTDVVNSQKEKIQEENDLNSKEFDTSLGSILNPDPVKKVKPEPEPEPVTT